MWTPRTLDHLDAKTRKREDSRATRKNGESRQ